MEQYAYRVTTTNDEIHSSRGRIPLSLPEQENAGKKKESSDGISCPSLSPMMMGPVYHDQYGEDEDVIEDCISTSDQE